MFYVDDHLYERKKSSANYTNNLDSNKFCETNSKRININNSYEITEVNEYSSLVYAERNWNVTESGNNHVFGDSLSDLRLTKNGFTIDMSG